MIRGPYCTGADTPCGAAAPVVPVDDEGVDRDLWIAEDDGERVRSEDGETDRHLPTGRGMGTGKDREDDAMTRVVEQSAEPGGGGVPQRQV